ncbi:unnamed protein product [Cuscuta europaea]|uniref:Uncharacterized protein n=1 Tax=Cuscuta europaea TaxID=41803 RepID=A0A9P0ZKI9_CUSEU|nr:unnamed protein product [Cuscuta europaea]
MDRISSCLGLLGALATSRETGVGTDASSVTTIGDQEQPSSISFGSFFFQLSDNHGESNQPKTELNENNANSAVTPAHLRWIFRSADQRGRPDSVADCDQIRPNHHATMRAQHRLSTAAIQTPRIQMLHLKGRAPLWESSNEIKIHNDVKVLGNSTEDCGATIFL